MFAWRNPRPPSLVAIGGRLVAQPRLPDPSDDGQANVLEFVQSVSLSGHGPAPAAEVDEHHDDGNHQQDVNKSAHCVTGHQTKQPQNDQYYCYCV
jgi:hypothetical protein